MKLSLSRSLSLKIAFLLDECIPPIIRDTRWFTAIPLWILVRQKHEVFAHFKSRAMALSGDEFAEVYRETNPYTIPRITDLNEECIEKILTNVQGNTVLEVGCGRGYLANLLSNNYQVTATDVALEEAVLSRYPQIKFQGANIENLPFEDNAFDTVITTHTLEHVQNLFLAIQELRRVAKQRLIIVVPKQRPYRYTFDLHLHFFPYEHSLLAVMGTGHKNSCMAVGGDLFYVEDLD